MNDTLHLYVGIATSGRREQLNLTLRELAIQDVLPERVLVCPARPDDIDEAAAGALPYPLEVVYGARGLAAQRNTLLRAAQHADVLVMFDDDFYPAHDYLARARELFAHFPDVVIATHHPELDGASGVGISHAEALRALAQFRESGPAPLELDDTYAGYGCNMALRLAPVRAQALWFDENLPLYAWLEDVDFSRRLAPYGRIVRASALRGVHLGSKRGRTSGVRLGYSQIANPLYMLQKGSLSLPYALGQASRNLAKNTLRALWPEPWVDRAGRLKGNTIALRHLLSGRLHPLKALELE